jgi:hypothetical protein
MHHTELQALRRLLFLTPGEAARWLAADSERPQGVEERTWNRWEAGTKPTPDNVAAAVLALVDWRAQQVARLVADIEASTTRPHVLPWVDDADDWKGGGRARWRAHQSACAEAMARTGPAAARLGAAGAHPPTG